MGHTMVTVLTFKVQPEALAAADVVAVEGQSEHIGGSGPHMFPWPTITDGVTTELVV